MTNTAEQRPGIGHNHPPEDVSPAPYYVTYPELRALGIPYSRKHLLEMMRSGRFPKARQLSANRVGWVHAEILEHLATRPVARAALFREKKVRADPGNGGADQATTFQPESSPQTQKRKKVREAPIDPRRVEAVVQHIIAHSKNQANPLRQQRVHVSDPDFWCECQRKTGCTKPEYKAAIEDPRLDSIRTTQGRKHLQRDRQES